MHRIRPCCWPRGSCRSAYRLQVNSGAQNASTKHRGICAGISAETCRLVVFFFFQAEDGIRDLTVTGVQTCALPICTHAAQVTHMIQMIERAMDHQGFSVIECLSECVEFFPDVFDPANPKKGGKIGRASCRERV